MILVLFHLLPVIRVEGQPSSTANYETDFLTNNFHKSRRELLRSKIPDSSCAILFSNPERNRSGDVDFEYHQNPDFYYLTGFKESNSILIIWKEDHNVEGRTCNELLFVQPENSSEESWKGKRTASDKAAALLGISCILSAEKFAETKGLFDDTKKILYTGFPKGISNDRTDPFDLYDLIEIFKTKSEYPSNRHDDYLLGKILRSMREIKQEDEIVLMRKAIDISIIAHKEMMKALHPGMTEYQVEAVGEYFFANQGAECPAYPSICGGGENSCILHYETNRRKLNDGDMIVLDMGAEYHGYAADITRTLPVNGTYSPNQKKIYDLVLKAQNAAIEACRPGNKFYDPDIAARRVLKDGLLESGIIQKEKDLDLYYTHATSHYLGLNVHDVGIPGKLLPGMVITVEPGLYFPEGSPCDATLWNIGIRIEDDILITDTGHENLSAQLPRQTTEIEAIMKEKSIFDTK